jgi:hypothetical protein
MICAKSATIFEHASAHIASFWCIKMEQMNTRDTHRDYSSLCRDQALYICATDRMSPLYRDSTNASLRGSPPEPRPCVNTAVHSHRSITYCPSCVSSTRNHVPELNTPTIPGRKFIDLTIRQARDRRSPCDDIHGAELPGLELAHSPYDDATSRMIIPP